MPFTAYSVTPPDSVIWILTAFDVFLIVGIIVWRVWTHYDTKNNWVLIGKKDGYTYEQHKTKRKRRCIRKEGRANADWLKFKTDEI
jgi:hypothetical protein